MELHIALEGHRKQDGLLHAADAPNRSLLDDGFGHAKDAAREAGRAQGARSVWGADENASFLGRDLQECQTAYSIWSIGWRRGGSSIVAR
jgi:hypothetical protein